MGLCHAPKNTMRHGPALLRECARTISGFPKPVKIGKIGHTFWGAPSSSPDDRPVIYFRWDGLLTK